MDKGAVGRNVATVRAARGMTQKALAEASGVPVATLRNYEQGRTALSIEHLARLAPALKISTDCLLGIKPMPKGVDSSAAPKRGRPKDEQPPKKRGRPKKAT